MYDHIRIRKAPGVWVIRADGAVLGESAAALELTEDGHAPVIYFPRGDVAMALLDRSATTTACPFKGIAAYYAIVTGNGAIRDAVWTYEAPLPGVEAIAGYLAFDTDKVTVERL